ncbi:MAG: hypothetical protein OEV44_06780 [Spirochaetota bacterium]|nr:hypothetical protein [Spirochaetota bacterium]
MLQDNIKVKGPRGREIDLPTTLSTLRAFSDDTIYAAVLDIIFSLELSRKDEYTSFVKELFALIKEQGARVRLEQALAKQIDLLQKRKPKQETKEEDISKVFSQENTVLDNLSSDLKLQLDITNYILNYFKKGDFAVVEKCLDVLLERSVLLNTVKNFVKKEIDFYINEQDSENIKRLTAKYGKHSELAPVIKEKLDEFLEKRKPKTN